MKYLNLLLLCGFPLITSAQTDSSKTVITVSGYAEPYYGLDLSQPDNHQRPGFVYSYSRDNEVNINLAMVKAALNSGRVHANVALMAGAYANTNLASEPGTLKNIYEANVGVKLLKDKDLWIDAGIFPSHIGSESAIGKDCWTLTRSLGADNSPYYESGAKISYTTADAKWFFSLLALNGWQHIQRPDGINRPSAGWQIQYKPNDVITLNSSAFLGTDKPDVASISRFFHDFYGIFQWKTFGLSLGMDTGWEENPTRGEKAYFWYSPVIMAKTQLNDKLSLTGRAEFYSDKNGVIVSTGTPNGFQTMGLSANVDVKILENAMWRLEGKWWNSKDLIFTDGRGNPDRNNAVMTTALLVWF